MRATRREFLHLSAAGSLAGACGLLTHRLLARQQEAPRRPLNLLILGGTGFLGPHVVEHALGRGHAVTLFNRGRTNPQLFPDVPQLRGDRDPRIGDGLRALEGTRWDGVIDTSGYVPRIVGASARLLAEAAGHYVFVSTISVYDGYPTAGMDESAAIARIEEEASEDVSRFYGPLKALCERAAESAMPGRVSSIRPGLIVGPLDPTDRFTYWPVRIAQGGEVLAPGSPDDPVQYIDARDLAAFIIRAIERRTTGVFNVTGPVRPTNIAELLYGCKAVTGSGAQFTWVEADFLAEQNVQAWSDMPAWVPPRNGMTGFMQIDCSRAIEAGLSTRPLAQTLSDTLAWYEALPDSRRRLPETRPSSLPGISRQRERELLAAWHDRQRSA